MLYKERTKTTMDWGVLTLLFGTFLIYFHHFTGLCFQFCRLGLILDARPLELLFQCGSPCLDHRREQGEQASVAPRQPRGMFWRFCDPSNQSAELPPQSRTDPQVCTTLGTGQSSSATMAASHLKPLPPSPLCHHGAVPFPRAPVPASGHSQSHGGCPSRPGTLG